MSEHSFLTIRQVARTGLISEHYLRLRLKRSGLPGFYAGTRFLVDYAALVELLHRESASQVESTGGNP